MQFTKRLTPIVILTTLILIFFSRLFYPHLSVFVTPDFGTSDLLHGYYPIKYLLSLALKNNQIPLWTKLYANGYPLFADGQIGFFSIVNLILFKFLPFVWAINLTYVISFFIGGIGTYLLAQELGFSVGIALLSAIIFTFSGFNIAQITHTSLLQSAAFFPLELYLTEKILKNNRLIWPLIFSFVLSQQIFAGHQQMTAYSTIGVFLYAFLRILFNREFKFKRIGLLFLGVLVSVGLSAVQLIPSFELLQQSYRASAGNLLNYYPYSPKNLLAFLHPFVFGSPKDATYPVFSENWGIFWENTGYVGLLPILSFIASFWFIKSRRIKLFLSLMFISILLVLGKYSPLSFIFKIPPLSYFRVPSRFLFITDLSLALLAGLVLDKFLSKFKFRTSVNFCIIYGLVLIQTLNIFYHFYDYHAVGRANEWFEQPEIVKELKKDHSPYRIFTLEDEASWNEIFLNRGWANPEDYLAFKNGLFLQSNIFYNISKTNVDVPFATEKMIDYDSSITIEDDASRQGKQRLSASSAKLLGEFNTKYLIVPNSIELTDLPLIKSFERYSLHKNPFFHERARITDGSIKWLNDSNERIGLAVSAGQSGKLILADSFYPGWIAYVDDVETKIYPTNLGQREVSIPKGDHKINFTYEPVSFKIGAIISAISHLLLILFVIFLSYELQK